MAELLIVSLDQTFKKQFPLPSEGTLNVGREEDAEICLPRPSVSRLHAKFHCAPDEVIIEDTGSRNGVVLNNEKLEGKKQLHHGDKILIGEFAVMVQIGDSQFAIPTGQDDAGATADAGSPNFESGETMAGPAPDFSAPTMNPDYEKKKSESKVQAASSATMTLKSGDAADPFAKPQEAAEAALSGNSKAKEELINDPYVALRSDVHRELIQRMDLRQVKINELAKDEIRIKTQRVVEQIIFDFDEAGVIPKNIDKNMLLKDVMHEALGLGALEDLLADDDITEIMVNNKDQIYVERKGKITLSDKKFISDNQIRAVIERIVAPLGRRIDESSPMVDARLADGSRVNAIIPPLAISGSSITIRKFKKDPLTVQDLIGFGSFTEQMGQFFKLAVEAHNNIVISGGTGSGKTTLLNVMSSFIGEDERIVTIEDAAELQLRQPHIVSLETRPPNLEGKGQVTIRDLVKNSLRMRPDRIVVGECRGGEALDMLQAMNTGHDGSLTTGHANSPREMLSRLETMVLMAGMDLPIKAIREQVASAVHLVVQQSRLSDGSRRVIEVTEITGMEGDIITMQTIFKFEQSGFDENGKIIGRIVPSGFIPSFVEKLRQKGVEVPLQMFRG